jgi:hypothetical protein
MRTNVVAIAMGFVGIALIAWADWRIALGVFLFVWSNNTQYRKE